MTIDTLVVDTSMSIDLQDGSLSKSNFDNADFNSQKLLVINLISAISHNIREKEKLKRDKSSNPLAHIKISNKLESLISSAYNEMDILKSILVKIQNSKRLKSKYTDTDLNGFSDTINNLYGNLSTFESSIRYKSSGSSKRVKVDLDFKDTSEDNKPLSLVEQRHATESIRQWRERDEGFDRQLQEIGEAVDRIGDMASQIGQKAMDQAKNAIETVSKVQETTEDISAVSLKIKKVLKRQRIIEIYFRITLIVILLVLVAVFTYLLLTYFRR